MATREIIIFILLCVLPIIGYVIGYKHGKMKILEK